MQVVALLTSELVSNAVRHARAKTIAVRFEVLAARVRVEVVDEGDGFDPSRPRPVAGQPGGWGLHLVDELSSRWGVAREPRHEVWFELDR